MGLTSARDGAFEYACDVCHVRGNGRYYRHGWWSYPDGWFVMETNDDSMLVCSVECIVKHEAAVKHEHGCVFGDGCVHADDLFKIAELIDGKRVTLPTTVAGSKALAAVRALVRASKLGAEGETPR